jgi:hypothetical protein
MRKIFDIYINDKPFPVFDIEGKKHTYGPSNGCPETWWLDYTRDEDGNYIELDGQQLLVEMNLKERKLIPYIDKGVHRICWEVIYSQGNSMNFNWDEYSLRSYGTCTMRANGRDVYKFRHSELQGAMVHVQHLAEKIMFHPYNFFEPEKDDGRKIYFKSLPAFVRTGYDVGEIRIEPDYSMIPREKWWRIYELFDSKRYESADSIFRDENDDEMDNEDREECLRNDIINWGDALSDGHIYWFRD